MEEGAALADQMAEFARCIREGASPDPGPSEGLEAVAVLQAVIESARRAKVVEVAEFRD